MVKVVVKKSNNATRATYADFESALRTFKRKVNRDGVLQELRKREYYVKPGVKRRLKHEAAMKEKRLAEKKRSKYKRDY